MKLKIDENGSVVVQDDKPVYLHEDGKEVAFDAPGTVATIARINAEAKANRERAEAAEASLKNFDGISNPVEAIAAMTTLKNLDHKKLVDAGEVEKVKAEAIKALEEKYAPIVKKNYELENQLYNERIGGAFSRSRLIADKFAIPADMVQARFGSNFRIEEGRTVAFDASGNKVFSRTSPGNPAEFEEALEILVDQYPYKAQILRAKGASGGGASSSPHASGQKTLTRAQLDAIAPQDRAAALKGVVLTD